jgi:hypothetical protein
VLQRISIASLRRHLEEQLEVRLYGGEEPERYVNPGDAA